MLKRQEAILPSAMNAKVRNSGHIIQTVFRFVNACDGHFFRDRLDPRTHVPWNTDDGSDDKAATPDTGASARILFGDGASYEATSGLFSPSTANRAISSRVRAGAEMSRMTPSGS